MLCMLLCRHIANKVKILLCNSKTMQLLQKVINTFFPLQIFSIFRKRLKVILAILRLKMSLSKISITANVKRIVLKVV